MRFPLLVVAALASGGWALSETRAPRHRFIPILPRAAPVVPDPPPEAPPVVQAVRATPPKPVKVIAREEPPPPPPRVATVSGRVVDDRGRPVPDAKVHLDHGSTRITLDLDGDGRFSTVVAPGSYDVAAFDDVHDSVASGLDLKDGENARDLLFELPTAQPDNEE